MCANAYDMSLMSLGDLTVFEFADVNPEDQTANNSQLQ